MTSAKSLLRKQMIQMRNQLSSPYLIECSQKICGKMIQHPHFQQADTILFYMAFRNEVDVQLAIDTAWKEKKRVLLPRANPGDRSMTCFQVNDLSELQPGAYGILEPKENENKVVDPAQIHLVIVPGVAFDRNGYRLGYGGGYYDRFFTQLSASCIRLGVAFSEQMVETVYPEAHDVGMHLILTSDQEFTFA